MTSLLVHFCSAPLACFVDALDSPEERDQLEHMVRAGKSSAKVTTRARILLKTDEGWSAPKVAQALDVVKGTVFRVKRRFAEDGLDGALKDRPQAHRYRKLDDRGEAHLIALACSPAPKATTTGICACWRTGTYTLR